MALLQGIESTNRQLENRKSQLVETSYLTNEDDPNMHPCHHGEGWSPLMLHAGIRDAPQDCSRAQEYVDLAALDVLTFVYLVPY